jgi:precorrin-6B methylase 2
MKPPNMARHERSRIAARFPLAAVISRTHRSNLVEGRSAMLNNSLKSAGVSGVWSVIAAWFALFAGLIVGCDQPAAPPVNSDAVRQVRPAADAPAKDPVTAGVALSEKDTLPEEPQNATEEVDADEAAVDESDRYEFREDHDPNGIGKFYMGREIAFVMGFGAAPWLERPEREQEEATSRLLESLKITPGMTVADIGAGSGVLTIPMAALTGETGKVLAVDVQQEMLDLLDGKLRSRQIKNVELILGTEESPDLPAGSVDLALMVDVYHEFAYPYEMMLEISKAMKPGGRVVFVEFRMEDEKVPIKLVHKMSVAQVKKEIGLPEFRLKWKETIDGLPWQHIIVFERLADERRRVESKVPPKSR